MIRNLFVTLVCSFFIGIAAITAGAQTTGFTYQASFKDGANPANGMYDLEFALFDALTVGNQLGSTLPRNGVMVTNGIFSVSLDFGAQFPGANRFLEIRVRPTGGGAFTLLTPRQVVNSAPYSIKSINAETAETATNATQLGGVAANQYLQTNGNGSALTNLNAGSITTGTLSNERLGVVPIANGGTGSPTQNFVDLINPQTIGGDKTFSDTLSGNIVNAGTQFNIGGSRILSNAGNNNTIVGISAGANNSGIFNSFFGFSAGANNSGTANSFFGRFAGIVNNTGEQNSFFGQAAGVVNTSGTGNSFFGAFVASSNTTGDENSYFGRNAGGSNLTGSNNTVVGAFATHINNLTNATAIGHRAFVGQSNSLVLGSIQGFNFASSDTNVGIGTSAPAARFHVVGNTSVVSTPVVIFQSSGNQVPLAFRSGANEVARIRADSQGDLIFATVSGTDKDIFFRAGDDAGTDMFIQASSGNVAIGNINPVDRLEVVGNIRVGTGSTGCVLDNDGTVIAGVCSSDERLKQSITAFPATLERLAQLRPVHFYWKTMEYPLRKFGERQSFGLIAQEVEQVLPELVTEDESGMKAVRYNKLPILMLQAIKELKDENDALRSEIDELKQVVCTLRPDASVCKQIK